MIRHWLPWIKWSLFWLHCCYVVDYLHWIILFTSKWFCFQSWILRIFQCIGWSASNDLHVWRQDHLHSLPFSKLKMELWNFGDAQTQYSAELLDLNRLEVCPSLSLSLSLSAFDVPDCQFIQKKLCVFGEAVKNY